MFDMIYTTFHGFASVYITYVLIYHEISIIHFSVALFSRLRCLIFATLVRLFSMDVVCILFINSSFILGLVGFVYMCEIRAKLVYGNVIIYSQILQYLSKYQRFITLPDPATSRAECSAKS